MILEHLTILNYKNLAEASLDFSPNLNCFVGRNGVGKTNILDAVYYLSFCKSAFSSVESQNLRHGEPFFMIEGNYVSEDGETENIHCSVQSGSRKHFKRNRKEYKQYSEHIGLIPLIMLSPSDTYLIEGGGELRRRLMDVAIAQYDTAYIDLLNKYNKVWQQRNALLKQEECDLDLLAVWEEQMALYGERIYQCRDEFINDLIPLFQHYYSLISGDREQVELRYTSHCQRGPLLEVIQRDRAKDLAVGYSLHGIHRDDIEMRLGDYPIRREGSQGQNKSYVIALKLAQYTLLHNRRRQLSANATKPLLLLDDIFDKLDAERVERIVLLVSGDDFGQIFITDTNRDHLDMIIRRRHLDHKLFTVEDGRVG